MKKRVFADQYEALFARPWPVWGAAILAAITNVFLFALDRPFTASDLLNLGVVAGALVGALLSSQFALRVPARGELIKGAGGGVLLGAGATLAFGCNIGGFFSAVSALSLSGLGMMIGLGAGAFLGLRYLMWELEHRPTWSSGRSRSFLAPAAKASRQPLVGLVLVVALLALPFLYSQQGHGARGLFVLFGAAFGVIFQRSRLCLVRAFREPFMTGDAEHTRAVALAVVIGMLGFTILKFTDLKDKGEWVFPAAGAGGLLGGLIFGVGMVLAGGCGAGSIWRMGEGQVKLWAAVATFALSASLTRLVLAQTGVQQKLGVAVFMPSVFGWAGAIGLVVAVMLGWAALATWNEASGKFSAF